MEIIHPKSIDDLLSKLSPENRKLVERVRALLLKYGAKEKLMSLHMSYKFPNNLRICINTYKKKFPILSTNGYTLLQEFPLLEQFFDYRGKYVTKIYLKNQEIFEQKALEEFIKFFSKRKTGK